MLILVLYAPALAATLAVPRDCADTDALFGQGGAVAFQASGKASPAMSLPASWR